MSFNPHEILQRLRSQQNTNHSSGGSSSNYTNSNPPNTNNNFESNGESLLGLQQHPQSFNQAQYNNIQLQSNFNNNNNSNFHHAQGNRNNNNNQFVNIGQQQQQTSQQQPQSSAHNSLRNNSNLSGGRIQQGQAQISPSTDSIRNNNRQFNNNQQFQQVGTQAGVNRQNQRVQEKVPQHEGNSENRIDQYEELNNLNSNGNENDSNNTNNIQNGNNTNSIVEYLLDKVTFLEKQVMENTQQKQNNLQEKRNNSSNNNPSQFPRQTISPSRRAQTETLYDEVAQVISKEPVQKILQKKEKNFVSCASTNSKRFHAPKVAGKLNLEQLQKILTDYPSLSRPSLNIRITEADLMQ